METKRKRVEIVMIPTDNSSNILTTKKGTLAWFKDKFKPDENYTGQHLYFISDEPIKKGDWMTNGKEIYYNEVQLDGYVNIWKIIATTDKSLSHIENSIQHINSVARPSEAFLRKYCKAGGISTVDVEYGAIPTQSDNPFTNPKGLHDFEGAEWGLKTNSHNEITIHPIKNSWTENELFESMQYYLEYVQKNSYITPQDWYYKIKHF